MLRINPVTLFHLLRNRWAAAASISCGLCGVCVCFFWLRHFKRYHVKNWPQWFSNLSACHCLASFCSSPLFDTSLGGSTHRDHSTAHIWSVCGHLSLTVRCLLQCCDAKNWILSLNLCLLRAFPHFPQDKNMIEHNVMLPSSGEAVYLLNQLHADLSYFLCYFHGSIFLSDHVTAQTEPREHLALWRLCPHHWQNIWYCMNSLTLLLPLCVFACLRRFSCKEVHYSS